MAQRGAMESLFNGIGDAIADIRERAVEEAWFGQIVTERGDAVEWPQGPETQVVQAVEPIGEILPPEHNASESGPWPRLEHGTVLEGHAEPICGDAPRLGWPQAHESRAHDDSERNREVEIEL